ncbi:hypothetical protein C0583_03075 [Candidatus Parcubacteria bacterium]|nr:MAG: hypothetical protein C0583_03075 [Candidatus Parcubacteria bacterium]
MSFKIFAKTVEEISKSEFKPIRIKDKNGETKDLNQKETKEYILKAVHGGKTISQLEKILEQADVKGNQWEKRKAIMKIFEDMVSDKETKSEDKEKLLEALSEEEQQ